MTVKSRLLGSVLVLCLAACSGGNAVSTQDDDDGAPPTSPAPVAGTAAFTKVQLPTDPDTYLPMFGARSCELPALDSYAQIYRVGNIAELKQAYLTAVPGSAIVWANGTYAGFGSQILEGAGGAPNAPVTVRPETLGGVRFSGGTMSTRFAAPHTDYVGFTYTDVAAGQYGLIRHDGNFSKTRCNTVTNLTSGSAVGIYGHDNEVADNQFDGFGDIAIWQPSNKYDFSGLTPRLRNWYHHNTFRNTFGEGTPLMIGYGYFMPNGPTSDEDEAGAILEWNLFDGETADPETVSIKSGANVIRFNYFRNQEPHNHLSIRMGHNNLAYGNLFKMERGGYATRASGHNYQFLYNVAFGGGQFCALTYLHGEIDSTPLSPTYYAGHNGRYRKNILVNFRQFARVLSSFRTDGLQPAPDKNVIEDNIWAQADTPGYTDKSGIAPLSWFEANNTVSVSAHLVPEQIGRYRSRSGAPLSVNMKEVVIVPNSILGPITVDPASIPWLRDVTFTN